MSTNEVRTIKCDWDGCPTHIRTNVQGKDFATLIIHKSILYFHSTDCLAFYAGSYPIGYMVTGREPHPAGTGTGTGTEDAQDN